MDLRLTGLTNFIASATSDGGGGFDQTSSVPSGTVNGLSVDRFFFPRFSFFAVLGELEATASGLAFSRGGDFLEGEESALAMVFSGISWSRGTTSLALGEAELRKEIKRRKVRKHWEG